MILGLIISKEKVFRRSIG